MTMLDAPRITPAQRAVWTAAQIDDGEGTYALAWRLELPTTTDSARLHRAVRATLAALPHLDQALTQSSDGDLDIVAAVPGRIETRTTTGSDAQLAALVADARSRIGSPDTGPMHHHIVAAADDGRLWWIQAYHHVAIDGQSVAALTERVADAYNDDRRDRSARSRTDTASPRGTRDYWDAVIASLPDDQGLLEHTGLSVSHAAIDLPENIVERVLALADRAHTSPRRALVGLLSAYAATTRPPGPQSIGLAIGGHAPAGSPIAMTSSVVPFVLEHKSTRTVVDVLADVERTLTQMRPHTAVAPDMVTELLRLRRGDSSLVAPGINVLVAERDTTFGGDRARLRQCWLGPVTDLEFVVEGTVDRANPQDSWLAMEVRGASAGTEIRAHAHALAVFLDAATTAPEAPIDSLPLASPQHLQMLVTDVNETGHCHADQDVVEMFESWAVRTGDATAVVAGPTRLTYSELRHRSSQLAHSLVAAGVGPEARVAIDMTRSAEMVVSVMAVLAAGAAFVPFDPQWPQARRRAVVRDANIVVALRGPGSSESNEDTEVLSVAVALDRWEHESRPSTPPSGVLRHGAGLAYVIFTSGSTGRPKGAMIRHEAIASRMRWQIEHILKVGPGDASLFKAPLAFDISINELLLPLCSGGTVVVAGPGEDRDPQRLLELISRERVTFVYLVASMLDVLLETSAGTDAMAGVRHVWCGGEVLTPELFSRFRARMNGTLYHGYGPAEATIGVSHVVYDGSGSDRISTSIGRPNPGCRLYVLDDRLRPLPLGMGGELYAAGDLLGRGYVGASGMSAARFVADPFAAEVGGRAYRTGDRARWTDGGTLDFLGRADNQVKIRGMRVELEEIEAAAATHPQVRAAVVLVHAATSSILCGYVVPTDVANTNSDNLSRSVRAYLATVLPQHMIPAHLMVLDAFPTTVNGKVDRRALPAPDVIGALSGPLTDEQLRLAGHIATLLARDSGPQELVDSMGPDSDFFTLGGDSLAAMRLVTRINRDLNMQISVRAVFDHPTVAALSAYIDAADTPPCTDEEHNDASAVQTDERTRPMNAGERRMWLADRLSGHGGTYTVPLAFRVTGLLDRPALEQALADVTARHRSLRSLYVENDGALTVETFDPYDERAVPTLRPHVVSSSGVPQAIQQSLQERFDPSESIALRAHVFTHDDEKDCATLVLAVHHIATDEWSEPALLRTLSRAYAARHAGRIPVDLGAATLHPSVVAEDHDAEIVSWRSHLTPLPPVLDVPGWRAARHSGARPGRTIRRVVADDVAATVRAAARTCGASMYMATQVATSIALRACGSGEHFLTASPMSIRSPKTGRDDTDGDPDDEVGFHLNTVLLRADLRGNPTLRELFARTRDQTLHALAHSTAPYEEVVAALPALREQPPVRVMVIHQPHLDGGGSLTLGDVQTERLPVDTGTAKYDVSITLQENDSAIGLIVEYATDVVDDDAADTLMRRIETVLRRMPASLDLPVDALDLLDAQDHATLSRLDGARRDIEPDLTLDRIITRTSPVDGAALIFDYRRRDLGSVLGEAAALARLIIDSGHGPEDVVAIALDRSPELIVSLLAVTFSGAAYVPLDPELPEARIRYLLDNSGAATILTTADVAARLPTSDVPLIDLADPSIATLLAALPTHPVVDAERRRPLHGDHPAYVLYTSGSTGRPKGVAVSHSAIVNRLLWAAEHHEITAADVFLQKTPASFDVSGWEIFLPFVTGTSVVVVEEGGHRDPRRLAHLISTHDVSIVHFVPSMLGEFLTAATSEPVNPVLDARALRLIVCSGEPLLSQHAQSVATVFPRATLLNLYGPTEAAIDVTAENVSAHGPVAGLAVAIGMPVWNTHCRILDHTLTEVLPGAEGDLYLGGAQLARGYRHNSALTASRFVADPRADVPGARLYHSGDRARQRRDGSIEYLGRTDGQIKLAGQRIELAEVEAALLTHPGVRSGAAAVQVTPAGPRLVGYVVPESGRTLLESDVRATVTRILPASWVPARTAILDEIPLTSSGKLDRKGLPSIDFRDSASKDRVPTSDGEVAIRGAIAEALGLKAAAIGIDDDFFRIGGDSISAIRTVTLARRRGRRITEMQIFDLRTVAALAEASLRDEETTTTARENISRADIPVPLPDLARAAVKSGLDIDDRIDTVRAHIPSPDDLAATDLDAEVRRATTALMETFPALRTRIDRSRRRLWKAFEIHLDAVNLETVVHVAGVERAADVLPTIDVDTGPLVRIHVARDDSAGWSAELSVHHLALSEDLTASTVADHFLGTLASGAHR
ncbi:amino acid adenylation domain-containing protein [Rhodococcus sp. ARC_M12]|uniref:non-ribosomal peptide synthetase n=1 Tax=Rhodococcus sp. ARC_M12 TaxID=2928854 RepID=UPI001FB4D438|nr:non-ribosomal peptide synthetase [Rhodococcus sp. ARC_M12]MCJ0979436.1 amino acid adenylation domain-containing protein [Rhodococcus sp. ARC_M12]